MADAAANRRRCRRASVRSAVRIECRKGTTGFGANLARAAMDLSETGVRLTLVQMMQPGQEVEIIINAAGLARPLRMQGRIVWSADGVDGQSSAGVSFDKPLSFADAQRLIRLAK